MDEPKPRLGFRIERIALMGRSLRPGAPLLRFVHLTDLHLRALGRRDQRLVAVVNDYAPDFICLTGDIISADSFTWELAGRLVLQFRSRCGVFACPGNHEARDTRRAAVQKDLMARCGTALLINESRTVETPAGAVRLAGVDDLSRGWPSFCEALREGQGADYSILLSHAPLAARLIGKEAGVHLVLSGHTHGGQIVLPLVHARVRPTCHGGFDAGLYETPWGHVYVNRGFGASFWVPFRFRCPAEVAFFEVSPPAA